MATTSPLPKTMKALVVRSTSEPPTIETVKTPQPALGGAVVRILAANTISYIREIYNGYRKYSFPVPLTPGTSAIARVVEVGPDATKLKPGDLVFVDCTIHSRDEPSDVFLAAITDGHTPGAKKLMRDVYRDWTYAEYCLCPLENLILMDEKRLTGSFQSGGLGHKIEDLAYVSAMLVPYGGLRDIELKAGQTVIVAPATGPFGGAAVLISLAMGARVIAMGRNTKSLAKLKKRVPHPERVETVPITGDLQTELAALKKFGQIDAYFDIGPAAAYNSSHIKAAILSLRHGGRISLMGGYREDVAIPHVTIMRKNLRLYGKWMYERSDIAGMFKLMEVGMLKMGKEGGSEVVGVYPLEEWKEAWDRAAETGPGEIVVIEP